VLNCSVFHHATRCATAHKGSAVYASCFQRFIIPSVDSVQNVVSFCQPTQDSGAACATGTHTNTSQANQVSTANTTTWSINQRTVHSLDHPVICGVPDANATVCGHCHKHLQATTTNTRELTVNSERHNTINQHCTHVRNQKDATLGQSLVSCGPATCPTSTRTHPHRSTTERPVSCHPSQ
jgi:hypothetical protein